MQEIYERSGPPAPPAEAEDWPHGDGIPDDDVKSAIAAITHARQFWDKYEDLASRKAKQREKFYTSLDGHIARLEDVWEAVASYNTGNFSYTSRATTMDTILRDPETPSLWEELIAEQEAKDDEVDIIGYLTKKHGKKEKASDGPDVRKPVYVSWSKDQKPLYRTYTGMLVRQPDMVWLPNATVFAAEKEAKIRWRDVRGVLTLYETKQLNKTEPAWFLLNHAVRDVAIGYKKKLCRNTTPQLPTSPGVSDRIGSTPMSFGQLSWRLYGSLPPKQSARQSHTQRHIWSTTERMSLI